MKRIDEVVVSHGINKVETFVGSKVVSVIHAPGNAEFEVVIRLVIISDTDAEKDTKTFEVCNYYVSLPIDYDYVGSVLTEEETTLHVFEVLNEVYK